MKKVIPLMLNLIAGGYTAWYMHLDNPFKNSGALSKIGLQHHMPFIIWGCLTYIALACSILMAYHKHLSSKVSIPFLSLAAIGMVLTLHFPFDYDIKPDYYYHCTGALLFSAAMSLNVFLLFLFCRKKHTVFKIFTIISGAVLLGDSVLLLIFKETGLIEAFPIFAAYIMLSVALYLPSSHSGGNSLATTR